MIYNVILYMFCRIVLNSWGLPLYSVVAYSAALKTIDFVVEGVDRAKCAMIVSEYPNEICEALSDTLESGVTCVDATGGYSKRLKSIVYFVVNRYQVNRMKEQVHEIDSKAYIIMNEVADIFSNNMAKA